MPLHSAQHRFTLNAVMGRKAPAPEDKSCRANKLVAAQAGFRCYRSWPSGPKMLHFLFIYFFLLEEWMQNNLNNPKTVTEMLSGVRSSMCVAVESVGEAVSSFHRVGWDYKSNKVGRTACHFSILLLLCTHTHKHTHTHSIIHAYIYRIYTVYTGLKSV